MMSRSGLMSFQLDDRDGKRIKLHLQGLLRYFVARHYYTVLHWHVIINLLKSQKEWGRMPDAYKVLQDACNHQYRAPGYEPCDTSAL